jgi:hypothetical protein
MWRSPVTRSIASTAVLLLAVSGSAAVAASPAERAGTTKKADLVVKTVTGSLTGRSLAVSATVTNKAKKANGKAAKKSSAVVVLSTDAVAGSGDTELGMLAVGKLKPKKSATVSGTFTVPASVPAGTYYVAACADALGKVKEKKEKNNCSASAAKVTVAAPLPATVTVTYSVSSLAPLLSPLTGTATNGTCVNDPLTGGGVCTVTAGVGSVVLTPSSTGPAFSGNYTPGTSGPCDGVVDPSTKTMTFTAPTNNKSCVAPYF